MSLWGKPIIVSMAPTSVGMLMVGTLPLGSASMLEHVSISRAALPSDLSPQGRPPRPDQGPEPNDDEQRHGDAQGDVQIHPGVTDQDVERCRRDARVHMR